LRAPAPTLRTPERLMVVTALVHKGSIFRLGHRRSSDGEAADLDWMRPFFVVEYERLIGRGAQPKLTAWYLGVSSTRPRFVPFGASRHSQPGRPVAKCLPGIGKCLGMHVLV